MLQFLRKHQRYFFVFITVAVVVTFSFFGTSKTARLPERRTQEAFIAVDGTSISRAELNSMTMFLMTESLDQIYNGSVWNYNFLNDGVISKDFFVTGLSSILAREYRSALKDDLKTRLDKEHRYQHYIHPQASFISVRNIWDSFIPEMGKNIDALKAGSENNDLFDVRTKLFLGRRNLPINFLKQVIRMQENQHDWVSADPNLMYYDLSMFGYHNMADWFGPHFCDLVSQFIINASIIAEQKGYKVTNAEAYADLLSNSEESFQNCKKYLNLEVSNSTQYMHEHLNRMGFDDENAVKVWRRVLLFRRLFHECGNVVLESPLAYEKFNSYANASVEADFYHLPEAFKFKSFRGLQRFQVYLSAISKLSINSAR